MNKHGIPRVANKMNLTSLKMFRIIGLFGKYNIDLPFEKQVNIYIGENGLGKTTILNCLYYTLEKNYTKLESIAFERIEILFKDVDTLFSITKADIIAFNRKRNKHRMYHDEDYLDFLLSDLGISINSLDNLSSDEIEYLSRKLATIQGIPINIARRRLFVYFDAHQNMHGRAKGDEKKVQQLSKAISDNLSERIIYLPTYRRIENDFSSFNIRNEEINNSEMLIRFGMSDVQKSIDVILEEIRSLAMQGYNKMTGILLEQYVENDSIIGVDEEIDQKIVRIVLDRLGDKIKPPIKEEIFDLVKTKKIYNEHLHLLNLLRKLIENYDQQKRLDDCINGFVCTCNNYLKGKHLEYDPSNLTLGIYFDGSLGKTDEMIKLTQLSSGEKQIVSLFSKLYLEANDKSIVIIDEPELSLSINWQQMLLPDIMRSGNCAFLLTVTHSPFIFENEFDGDAREMRAHMTLQ